MAVGEWPLSWVEVSRSALRRNVRLFRSLLGETTVVPVVKSNAYGHGTEAIVSSIGQDVTMLAVVQTHEALDLPTQRGRDVLVLSFVREEDVDGCIHRRVILPIYDIETARLMNRHALRLKRRARVHIKIDVGTTRIGVLPSEADRLLRALKRMQGLSIEGVFSHFADSENADQRFTLKQLDRFHAACARATRLIPTITARHIACSAAALLHPDSRLTHARIGISLYGLWPSAETQRLYAATNPGWTLTPVLSWKTRIVQVKRVPKGTAIGYGCTYTTQRSTSVAVLPVGYWDGYDRKLSNCGEVLVRGQRCRVLGNVCMNMTMIDATGVRGVRTSDTATLIGTQKSESISADQLARKIGTINYEVTTRINPRIPRVCV